VVQLGANLTEPVDERGHDRVLLGISAVLDVGGATRPASVSSQSLKRLSAI
jgi:hypothetical protein